MKHMCMSCENMTTIAGTKINDKKAVDCWNIYDTERIVDAAAAGYIGRSGICA